MLQIKNINGDETAIQAYNVAITETLNSLSTLNFAFVDDIKNRVGADMMIPRTIITEPITQQKFRIATSNPVPNNKYRIYTVSANHVGADLHENYVEQKLIKTQSLKACMDLVTKGTKFSYEVHGNFSNYSFSEGFGTGFSDELLSQLAKDFKFEFYFDNYTIHIKKSIGKSGAFLFVDKINVAKISVNEDYTVINTYMKGYAGTPNEKTGEYPISAEYYSPLADDSRWGKIDGGLYTNENMKEPALKEKLKEQVHDYPDVQYSVSYVDFRKNVQGFNNDTSVGNYGWLRDRFGIDVSVRIQARTFYPQDSKNTGSITFGNTTYDSVVLDNQIRKGWEDNLKLGEKMQHNIREASNRSLKAWNARIVAKPIVPDKLIGTQDNEEEAEPRFVLTLPEDNPLGLPEGTQLNIGVDAKYVHGLGELISSSQIKYDDATQTQRGLMTSEDKLKLDSIHLEPFDSVQIRDAISGSVYILQVENGELKISLKGEN